jgi:hypothetical protein
MAEHDSFLHAVLSTVGGSKYTVIYATTPSSSPQDVTPPLYEMDHLYDASLHSELKRDVGSHAIRTAASGAPLFEKYVFLSSGMAPDTHSTLLLLTRYRNLHGRPSRAHPVFRWIHRVLGSK